MNRLKILISILSISIYAYAFDAGIPSGERGLFGQTTKYFFGDYQSAADTSIWSSSGAMKPQVLDSGATTQAGNPLLYGTTSWYMDIEVVPGNTYYYWFEADYGAERMKEQVTPGYHTVFFDTSSALVILDGVTYSTGAFASLSLWHNWAGAPPSPVIFEAIRNTGEVNLKWYEPKISGQPVLDLFGGGYEVYRSTYSEQVSTSSAVLLNGGYPIPASYSSDYVSYSDKTVVPGQTYYYAVRSYDAYLPSYYSGFSQSTSPAGGLWYVRLSFKVDVSRRQDVKSVQIISDFTDPAWKKMPLFNNGDGTWAAVFADGDAYIKQGWLVAGRNISYKYMINDSVPEPDQPVAFGGPYRKTTISDPEMDGVMPILDIWAVPTLPEGGDLPLEICSFSIANTTYYADISWEAFAVSSVSINGFELSRSTLSRESGYMVVASTQQLPLGISSFRDYIGLGPGVTAYYRIVTVDSSGRKSGSSTPLLPGKEIPSPVTGMSTDGLAQMPGYDTGIVYLEWTVPEEDQVYGPATYFIVRKSTYPLPDYTSWKKAEILGKQKSHYKFEKEYMNSISLGDNCPGFFFTIGTIYSSWTAVGLSNSVMSVAPKIIGKKEGGTITKANYSLGSSTDGCKTALKIERNSFKSAQLTGIIRNFYELQRTGAYTTKIADANSKAVSAKRLKFVPANETSKDGALPGQNTTIFSFELYDETGNDYFADRDKDGAPDRFAARPMTVNLPYQDSNRDGIVDSTENDPVKVDELRVYRLNEVANFWKELENAAYTIDKVNNVIKVEVRELSVYALFGAGSWAEDLSTVAVYPNPFRPYDGVIENGEYGSGGEYEGINFVNLTKNARVFIYNIAAELVYNADEVQTASPVNGKWRWNARNSSGAEAASGVYIYIVKDGTLSGGKKDKTTGKIVIIR